jgi:hypothetical protein
LSLRLRIGIGEVAGSPWSLAAALAVVVKSRSLDSGAVRSLSSLDFGVARFMNSARGNARHGNSSGLTPKAVLRCEVVRFLRYEVPRCGTICVSIWICLGLVLGSVYVCSITLTVDSIKKKKKNTLLLVPLDQMGSPVFADANDPRAEVDSSRDQ